MDDTKFFNQFGGTALGLRIANRISANLPKVSVAKYDIILADKFRKRKFYKLGINETLNKESMFKFSREDEDFSEHSIQGKNSSRFNPIFVVNSVNFDGQVFDNDNLMKQIKNQKSIILQELINKGYFFIYQEIGNEITAEISIEGEKLILFGYDNKFSFESTGKTNVLDLLQKLNIKEFIDIHSSISKKVNFDINTEGFLQEDSKIILVQLRPTPKDFLKRLQSDTYYTILTFGCFYIYGKVMNYSKFVDFDEEGEKYIFLYNRNEETLNWDDDKIRKLILKNDTLFIGMTKAFKISHSPSDIPPDNSLRRNFKFAFFSGDKSSIENKYVLAKGNGKIATIRIDKEKKNDNERCICGYLL